MSYTDDSVLAKLSTLAETQESIVTVAQWIMFHRRHADRTVQIWLQRLKDSTSHKRLNLIYLANEVCQQSKVRHKEDFLVAFSPFIAEGTATAYKGAPVDIQQRIRRVVDVWKERKVFEEPIQAAVDNRIDELDKVRGTSKAGFGGAIFGSSSASIPPELSALVPPQQSISKLALSTKTSLSSANQDYGKLMGPSADVPSAPVYAAKLNGLLKTLANAEGAVEQCVKARKTLVEELQKILDTNKAALAADEEQLDTFKQRKVEVDDKKREVEFAIMQGLSDNDAPASNGLHDQTAPEPDMPEVEALTPPSMEPEHDPSEQDSSHTPEWSAEPSDSSAAPNMEMLSNVTSHYKSMPSTNGSKKRRLDSGDDFPDLGGDDGIDADVAEMLRKDSISRSPRPGSAGSPRHPRRGGALCGARRRGARGITGASTARPGYASIWGSPVSALRCFSTSKVARKDPAVNAEGTQVPVPGSSQDDLSQNLLERSEKATKAAQVNLRARLSKEKDPKRPWYRSSGEIIRLLRLARPELKSLTAAVLLLLVSSAVTMSIPLTVGKVMDAATKSDHEESKVFGIPFYQFFTALAVVLTVGATANFGRIILLRIVGERVVARLRSKLYRKTYVQDAEFFDANRVGDLISRLSSDTIIIGKSITQNVSDGLRSLISGFAGLSAMAWISPGLTTVIFFTGPFLATAAFVYARFIRKISRDIQKNIGTLSRIAEERLGNVKTSQAFAGEIQEVRRYNNQVREIFSLGKKESIYSAAFFGSTGWMGNMTILMLLWFGGGYVRDGLLSLGDLTSFMMYAAFTGSSLVGLSGFFSELMKGVGAATRLFELEDRPPRISPTEGVKVVSAQGPIKFSNVSFAYPTRPAVAIFNNLDFEIPSGSNVCIVGPSGGGKSTVASLLLRFYNLDSGSISINGMDISRMNVKSLRRRIGMVSQEPVLFSGTIAENIAYGRPRATTQEIIAAARKANCLQFISDFPKGLQTDVGARGTQLSGGQKQRIAIARALLKDPDILILDEATSALDAESETLVNSALGELLKGRSTTISIAHRLSTIKRSDQIIVLNNQGSVAEIGSYVSLSADKSSAFSKLMEWQISGGDIPPAAVRRDPHLLEREVIEEELAEAEEEEVREEESAKSEPSQSQSQIRQ
ncbi:hypothetical protein BX600DRAFT_387140 [Xylariales sp. PMI_506]|nr:hypothetical protein BX600DRAFT_387140 [Xylariales sp. PMI_506]